jgi:hypothetical protein
MVRYVLLRPLRPGLGRELFKYYWLPSKLSRLLDFKNSCVLRNCLFSNRVLPCFTLCKPMLPCATLACAILYLMLRCASLCNLCHLPAHLLFSTLCYQALVVFCDPDSRTVNLVTLCNPVLPCATLCYPVLPCATLCYPVIPFAIDPVLPCDPVTPKK